MPLLQLPAISSPACPHPAPTLAPQTPMCMQVLEGYALPLCDSPNRVLGAVSESPDGKQRDTTPQSVLQAEASPVGRGP